MRTLVPMDADGRLIVPTEARVALHVEGAAQFEVEVAGDALILHPVAVPAEDAWAYTPEHLARVDRARQQARSGQTQSLTEAEIETRATR